VEFRGRFREPFVPNEYRAPRRPGKRRRDLTIAAVAIIVGAAVYLALTASPTMSRGQMLTPRYGQTATLLLDGRVLIAGGITGADFGGFPAQPGIASAELYDPVSGTFSATGSMAAPRVAAAATRLADGRVFIDGGENFGFTVPPAMAEIYDPKQGTFSPAGSTPEIINVTTATLLGDGRVLVIEDLGVRSEVYDPATGRFSQAGSMAAERMGPAAALLPNNRVLISGGDDAEFYPLASAAVFDPATGTFSATGSMAIARDNFTATSLADGRVLVAGGRYDSAENSAEIYDPASGTFRPTGSMTTGRHAHTATLLGDGRVLICGGLGATQPSHEPILASAELYDPVSGTFSPTGSMADGHNGGTATLLLDGRVLMAGGNDDNGRVSSPVSSAEIYDPKSGTWGSAG